MRKTEENLFITYKEFDSNPSQSVTKFNTIISSELLKRIIKMATNERFIMLQQAEN